MKAEASHRNGGRADRDIAQDVLTSLASDHSYPAVGRSDLRSDDRIMR
jgi:hypothetical protein